MREHTSLYLACHVQFAGDTITLSLLAMLLFDLPHLTAYIQL